MHLDNYILPKQKKDTACVLTVPAKPCLTTVSQMHSIKSIENKN
nr:MAG TPA: hypothetical protein [Caudoviricetes sp.]